jgi:RNA-directed DNA polymerase
MCYLICLCAIYALCFDKYMNRRLPDKPFRQSNADALMIKTALAARLQECGLEIDPDKTKIVYCKSGSNSKDHAVRSVDFLGYTFRTRRSITRKDKVVINFYPGMSAQAGKAVESAVTQQ